MAERASLKVLMISTDSGFFAPDPIAGDVIERHRLYADRVTSLDIIVFGRTAIGVRKLSENLTVHATGVKGFANIGRALRIAEKIMKNKKIDLIVTQDPHATGYVGRRLKKRHAVPLIVHFHGDFWKNPHWRRERWQHRVKEVVQQLVVTAADGIRVVSPGIRDKLIRAKIPESSIATINTPINDSVFLNVQEDQKIMLEKLKYKYQGKFVLLFCGRLVAAKNLFFTLEVIEQLRKKRNDFSFLIIGQGPEHKALKEAISRKRLDTFVSFVGGEVQSRLVVYYHLANTLLLLSTNESFGKVIIEAGLAGTPTLASATTGASYIIRDGRTGFLVPVNDLKATTDVLHEMIDYPEQTKDLGQRAQADYRERFSSEQTIKNMIDFWKRIAGRV